MCHGIEGISWQQNAIELLIFDQISVLYVQRVPIEELTSELLTHISKLIPIQNFTVSPSPLPSLFYKINK